MGWGMDVVNNVVEGVQDAGNAVVDGVRSAASYTAEGFNSACDWVHDQLTPDIRPEGTDGHQIYVWFHHGAGTGSLDEAVRGWGKVSEKHSEVATELDGALGMMRSSWKGEAADSAESSVRPLREAADTASSRCREAGKALEAQSSGFNESKKNVVDVPSEPPTMNPVTVTTNPTGYAAEAQNYQAQQQQNQMSLRGYGDTTGSNTGAVPSFDGSKEPSQPGPPDDRKPGDGTGIGGFGGDGSGSGSGSNVARPGGTGAGGYAGPAGTDQAGTSGHTGGGTGSAGGGTAGGAQGSGNGLPGGTRSAWWSQRDSVDPDPFAGDQRGTLAGAAGGAGLAAGGAVLGGGLLGGKAEGAGISGRGIPGTGTGTGAGTGTGTGGRGGAGSLPGGGRGGVGNAPSAPSATGAGVTRAGTGAGAPMGGAAGRGQQQGGEGDDTHERPDWLLDENDPNELFGTSERTAPPVLGATSAEQGRSEGGQQQ
ncbi:PPE domain-containing protein [Actinopolyspora saharensis]|uniref:PPE domain-containing protein n=1 Tax=Actinopolyspora saharensis TaxID=995062 RepID=UPI003F6764AC